MRGHIYMLFNRISRKWYIGKSKYPFEHPQAHWRRYLRGDGDPNQHIVRAISKFGADNFAAFCLESCIPESLLNSREMFHVLQYNSKKRGYNTTEGGDGGNGYEWTEAQRQRQSDFMLGNENYKNRKFSDDALHRIGDAQSGKTVSAETRKKLRNANLGKKHTAERRQSNSLAQKKAWRKRKHNPNQLTLFD